VHSFVATLWNCSPPGKLNQSTFPAVVHNLLAKSGVSLTSVNLIGKM
jgi:hypothetical protein